MKRLVILDVSVRLIFHAVLITSVYLLFAGHNQPGGGFVGGLVAGSAFVLRYAVTGREGIDRAVPLDPALPLGAGLLLSAGTGAAAWLFDGTQFLESGKLELDVPVLGVVKATSALPFDTGVFLVVVGLVLVVLRTLGAEAEQ